MNFQPDVNLSRNMKLSFTTGGNWYLLIFKFKLKNVLNVQYCCGSGIGVSDPEDISQPILLKKNWNAV